MKRKCKKCKGEGVREDKHGLTMYCPDCNGTGEVEVVGDSITDVCDKCGGTGDTINNIPPTNEDWFCRLSTEEKAKWFCDHITCSDGCPFNKQCLNEDMGRKLWQKWLGENN